MYFKMSIIRKLCILFLLICANCLSYSITKIETVIKKDNLGSDRPVLINNYKLGFLEDSCKKSINDFLFEMPGNQSITKILHYNNQLILGGNSDESALILICDFAGSILFAKEFNLTQADDIILDMIVSSKGDLIAVGSYLAGSSFEDDFVISLSLLTYQTNFVRTYTDFNQSILFSIVEDQSTGNLILGGQNQTFQNDLDYLFMTIDKNGNLLNKRSFSENLPSQPETIYDLSDIVNENGNDFIYGATRITEGSGFSEMRATMTKFNLQGDIIWSGKLINTSNDNARMYLSKILYSKDHLYSIGIGDLTGTSLYSNTIQYYDVLPNGTLNWAYNILIPNFYNQRAESIIDVNNDKLIIISGQDQIGLKFSVIVMFDNNGIIKWSKKITNTKADQLLVKDAIYINTGVINFILLAGTYGIGNQNPFFLAISENGTSDCSTLTDYPISTQNLGKYTGDFNPIETIPDINESQPMNGTKIIIPQALAPCTESYPDLIPLNLKVPCDLFSPSNFTICNNGLTSINEIISITVFTQDPTKVAVLPFFQFESLVQLLPNECLEFIEYFPTPLGYSGLIFLIINNNLNPVAPLELTKALLNPNSSECDFSNNMISGFVSTTSLSIDLGSDVKLCFGKDTSLTVPNNLKEILWNTGESTNSIIVNKPGWYAVSVVDNCGNTAYDSIFLEYKLKPNLNLPQNLSACESYLTELELNSSYLANWYSTSDSILCNNCSLYAIDITKPTTIYLDFTIEGCLFKDSIFINLKSQSECIACESIFIPNAFSPNGDGNNDRFTIFANDCIKEVKLLNIYDRWGELVFSNSNFPPNILIEGWDGKMNDKTFKPAVFVYYCILSYSNKQQGQFSGEINLMR